MDQPSKKEREEKEGGREEGGRNELVPSFSRNRLSGLMSICFDRRVFVPGTSVPDLPNF
jgi:hypothetical protein